MWELSANALEKKQNFYYIVVLLEVGLDNAFVVCCFSCLWFVV